MVAQQAGGRHGGHLRRRRVLRGGLRRGRLQLRRRQLLRQHRQHAPQPAGRRHGGRAGRRRLLAGGRPTAASSATATPPSTAAPAACTSTSPWSGWPPPRAATATGWWPSDGGIFSYGDASFHGSTGSLVLNKPIVGMITGPAGAGYFLVASDGGIFSFGTAPFYGSLGGLPLKNPIVAAAATPTGNGYWFTDDAGLVSNFGSADYYGSAPSPLFRPIVGMAEAPGQRCLRRRDLPLGRLRLRHQHVPVRELPGRRPPDRHRAGGRVHRTASTPQPVPGRRSGLGGRRAQPVHLPDLRHLGHERAGVQR